MALIDEDIAKYIWGYFLEFDDGGDDTDHSTTMDTSPDESLVNRRVDFRSIRSLRCVNKIFYTAFEEVSGWSRCALMIKREYRNLKNDEKFFDNWNLAIRLQTLRTNHFPPTQNIRNQPVTREERKQVGMFVSKAMERKKVSVYRCNQLIRMLDRGPFTKDEKLLTNQILLVVQ